MNVLSIEVDDNYDFPFEKEFKEILNVFKKVLDYKKKLKVDVLITNNKKIKKISKNYRNIDKETDVLSFPFEFNFLSTQLGFNFLGEIVLSYEKIEKQALEFNHSIKREFCFLFAHGLVHLSGKDHKTIDDENSFNSLVYEIMDKVKIKRS
ncbi:MAG: rRNA maturation RNase YbeY [Mycoplasma sp.]|nr:rRNA maturation RNase YbeY [Mycoplasma sp.]